jgi:truncated hemoglobin YjbI
MGKLSPRGWILSVVVVFGLAAACQSNKPEPLYNRMGGDVMISAVVNDFIDRAMGDPRVNFTRAGTSAEWHPTPDSVLAVRTHLIQFVESAAGGPVD